MVTAEPRNRAHRGHVHRSKLPPRIQTGQNIALADWHQKEAVCGSRASDVDK